MRTIGICWLVLMLAGCSDDTSKPDAAIDAQVDHDAAQPDAAKPDAAKPDAAKPDAAKPDAAKPDAAKADAAKADAAKADAAKADAAMDMSMDMSADMGPDAFASGPPMVHGKLPGLSYGAEAALDGFQAHVIGGYNTGYLATHNVIDIRTLSAGTPLKALPAGRLGGAALFVAPSLYYVHGGSGAAKYGERQLYRYEATGWKVVSSGPTPRHGYSSFYLPKQGSLYFVAGMNLPSSHISTVESVTPAGAWSTHAAYPGGTIHWSAGCASGPDDAVVSGGYLPGGAPTKIVYSFKGTGAVWKKLPDMPRVRFGHALFCWQGKLYVIGGFAGVTSPFNIKEIDIYDPKTGWSTSATKLTATYSRGYAADARYENFAFLFGGYSYSEAPKSPRDQITRIDLSQL